MFNNQLIIIFIIYYIIFIIHVFQHIHFYELFFHIHQSKLVSFFLNHSYTTITLLEVIRYFHKMTPKSHAKELLNFVNLPELFQHARTVSKNPKDYYHISASKQGYDALSFNPTNLQKIETEKNIGLVTLHEKKTLKSSKVDRILKYVKEYSVSKNPCDNRGVRPAPVDQLEVGLYSTDNYNKISKKMDLATYKKPSIILEDYSNHYTKIVFHHNHSGLGHGTIINNSAFEELKWFYNFLEKNEEMCLYVNNLLKDNPNFPLDN